MKILTCTSFHFGAASAMGSKDFVFEGPSRITGTFFLFKRLKNAWMASAPVAWQKEVTHPQDHFNKSRFPQKVFRASFSSYISFASKQFYFLGRTSLVCCLFIWKSVFFFFASKHATISSKVAALCSVTDYPETCFASDWHHDTKGCLVGKYKKVWSWCTYDVKGRKPKINDSSTSLLFRESCLCGRSKLELCFLKMVKYDFVYLSFQTN